MDPYLFLIMFALVVVLATWIGFRIADRQVKKNTKHAIVKVYAKGTRDTFVGDTEYYLLLQDYTGVKEDNYRFNYSDKKAGYMPVSESIYASADVSGVYKASFLGRQLVGISGPAPVERKNTNTNLSLKRRRVGKERL